MDDVLVERVLRLVEAVPPGRVVTYGDVAAALGVGPRIVGRVMATWGSGVAWWRVTNHRGELPPHLRAEALARWRDEGIHLTGSGDRCDLARSRWPIPVVAVRHADAAAGDGAGA